MDDLIKRQDAIDALQEEINKAIPPFDDVVGAIRCGVRLARNIIEDLPPVEPEVIAYGEVELKSAQQWIPCSERLPRTYCLFCDIDGDVFYGHRYDGKWWADGQDYRIKNVIAWMPLPQPWKESEE